MIVNRWQWIVPLPGWITRGYAGQLWIQVWRIAPEDLKYQVPPPPKKPLDGRGCQVQLKHWCYATAKVGYFEERKSFGKKCRGNDPMVLAVYQWRSADTGTILLDWYLKVCSLSLVMSDLFRSELDRRNNYRIPHFYGGQKSEFAVIYFEPSQWISWHFKSLMEALIWTLQLSRALRGPQDDAEATDIACPKRRVSVSRWVSFWSPWVCKCLTLPWRISWPCPHFHTCLLWHTGQDTVSDPGTLLRSEMDPTHGTALL